MPMAAPAPAVQTAMIPQVVQTSQGQQIVMQQVQIVQPQIQQPQFAQIMMPNGQLQQVQVVQPQQMIGLGAAMPQQVAAATPAPMTILPQLGASAASTSTTTTASSSTTATTTSTVTSGLGQLASPASTTSSASSASLASPTAGKLMPKLEPMEAKADDSSKATDKDPVDMKPTILQPGGPVQQQQPQIVQVGPDGQIQLAGNSGQVVVQQPAAAATAGVPQAQVLSVRTANGQVMQMQAPTQPAPTPAAANTVNIPGIGQVQIMNALPQPAQFGGAQIISAAASQVVQPAPATQQALQQDPNDPNKWHVVQVATAAAAAPGVQPAIQPAAAQPQTAQIVTANGAILGSATLPAAPVEAMNNALGVVGTSTGTAAASGGAQNPQKTRLRRVACTCPNCKDGDRTRGQK